MSSQKAPNKVLAVYADSFPCPEFVIPNVCLTKMYSCIFGINFSPLTLIDGIMLLACLVHKITLLLRKCKKKYCKQSCSFWLRYQPNRSEAWGSLQRSPRPSSCIRGRTSKERKGGERQGRKEGEDNDEGGRAPIEMMPPNQNPEYATG